MYVCGFYMFERGGGVQCGVDVLGSVGLSVENSVIDSVPRDVHGSTAEQITGQRVINTLELFVWWRNNAYDSLLYVSEIRY